MASSSSSSSSLPELLRRFLSLQQRRALVYADLHRGFSEYLESGSELEFQKLCSQVTADFNDCSKQVIEIGAALKGPDYNRGNLATILEEVQAHEKQKLQMTAQIQVLKKAGRPSERYFGEGHLHCANKSSNCSFGDSHPILLDGTIGDAEADAHYDMALNEAIRGVQNVVTLINERMEDIRYEIDELEGGIES